MAASNGIRVSEYLPVPILLTTKAPKKTNILVGDDVHQVRFAEGLLGVPCKLVESIQDEDVLGQQDKLLFRVDFSRSIQLTHAVYLKVGVFSLDPIQKRSAGANAIVRYAASLLGLKLEQKQAEKYSAQLDEIKNVHVAIWDALWLLTGPEPVDRKGWLEPWTSPRGWLPADVDPGLRLNTLYRDLCILVFARENDWDSARKFGAQKSRFERIKQLAVSVDLGKAYESIKELSRWRERKTDPLVCALRITKIWDR